MQEALESVASEATAFTSVEELLGTAAQADGPINIMLVGAGTFSESEFLKQMIAQPLGDGCTRTRPLKVRVRHQVFTVGWGGMVIVSWKPAS